MKTQFVVLESLTGPTETTYTSTKFERAEGDVMRIEGRPYEVISIHETERKAALARISYHNEQVQAMYEEAISQGKNVKIKSSKIALPS
jgi:uncharacterized protein (UPF0128 family)